MNSARSRLVWASVLGLVMGFSACLGQARTPGPQHAARKVYSLDGSAPAGRPFSSAIKCGPLLFLSGVIGTDLETNELVSDDVAGQTRQCLEKIGSLLRQAGLDFRHAVNVTVYLTDLADYDAMNEAYGAYFRENPPARACVQVFGLVRGARVEIALIAME